MDDAPTGMGRVAALADRRRIALIGLRGVIGGAVRTGELIRTLGTARRNRNVRAVVLEIDSPGGAAGESEALHLAVRRVAAEKPVVAWIRSTGASGAYFAACGASRILAFPSSIVGSIGVISVRPVAVEALRRLGASVEVTKTGPFKDLGAPWREPTDQDRAKERELVDAIFVRFTKAVAGARGFDDAQLARVATGEVWLGDQAVSLGLVDGLCNDEEFGGARGPAAGRAAPPPAASDGSAEKRPAAAGGARRGHGAARTALDRRARGLAESSTNPDVASPARPLSRVLRWRL